MSVAQLFDAIVERLHATSSVKTIYGDPIETQGRTIIPVAKVSYGFGAGSGESQPSEDRGGGEGGGGGGGVSVTPVGVVEVSQGRTRFIPIHDSKRIAGFLFLGFVIGRAVAKRRFLRERILRGERETHGGEVTLSPTRLLLVKHSLPEVDPSASSSTWRLSKTGRARCRALAEALAVEGPTALFTSREPKARETAEIVGARLGLPAQVIDGLEENDRTGLGYLGSEAYEETIRRFFDHPQDRVMGRETADEAHNRFAGALRALSDIPGADRPVVVAHGTVLTLYVTRLLGMESFPFWKRLGLPPLIVLETSERKIVRLVEHFETDRQGDH